MMRTRKIADNEKAKHPNMEYVIELSRGKEYFKEAAFFELFNEIADVVSKNDLLHGVSNRRELLVDFKNWWYGNRRDASCIHIDEIDTYLGNKQLLTVNVSCRSGINPPQPNNERH